jgi:hypothetical protein
VKKGRKTAEARSYVEEPEDMDLSDLGAMDRTLILKREPPPRKEQLMAHGIREIRCVCCSQIGLIADAEEFADGWICGDCLYEVKQAASGGRQRRGRE